MNIENIEEVDFVWDGRSYTELIGRRHIYDWIIGSHVLEHTTDLIGFLNDCDSLLKKDGVLSLAVPDTRYCFARFRPLSGIGRVIDAARNLQKIHSTGIAAEYFLTVASKGGRIAWDANEKGEFEWCIHWSKRNRRSAMWVSAGVISMSTNGVSHQLHFD